MARGVGGHPAGIELRRDAFDTEILGAPVARLLISGEEEAAGLEGFLKQAGEDWRRQGLWLVACRVADAWRAAQAALEASGFRPVERLLTFRRPLEPLPEECGEAVRGEASDADACAEVAGRAFRYDRYHADPAIADDRADALKAAWALNAVGGRADGTFVVREEGRAVGFNFCLVSGDDVVIDLIAVAPEAQGRGHGRALVDAARMAYSGRVRAIRAATQEANLPSTAMYRHLGFTDIARSRTFHWTNAEARG